MKGIYITQVISFYLRRCLKAVIAWESLKSHATVYKLLEIPWTNCVITLNYFSQSANMNGSVIKENYNRERRDTTRLVSG